MAIRKIVHGIQRPSKTQDGGVNWDHDEVGMSCEVVRVEQPEGEVPVCKIPCQVDLTLDEARELVKTLEMVEEQIAGTA